MIEFIRTVINKELADLPAEERKKYLFSNQDQLVEGGSIRVVLLMRLDGVSEDEMNQAILETFTKKDG